MSRGTSGSFGLIGEAMRSAQVRAGLRARAEQVQNTADNLASSDDVELESRVTEGTRPQGRPYARVSSPNVEQEYGSSKTARRRILGQAAERHR